MSLGWRLIQLVVQIYLFCLILLTFFQRSLIYQPTRSDRLPADKADSCLVVVDVTVKSDDGLNLNGWLQLAETGRGARNVNVPSVVSRGGPVVLYFPGNAGMRSYRAFPMGALGALNAHVMIMDYRGYADNPGHPSETAIARDARSPWNYLTGELQVSPDRIVINGESLGGAVATRLASDLCSAGIIPGGLIVQSTFSSLAAVAQQHFPLIPISLLLVDRYPSDQRIAAVKCPILQIHGKQDTIVPFEIGQRLFDAAPAQSASGVAKRQLVMPRTDHSDVYDSYVDDATLHDELRDFLELVHRKSAVASTQTDKDSGLGLHQVGKTMLPVRDAERALNLDWRMLNVFLLIVLSIILWWSGRQKPG